LVLPDHRFAIENKKNIIGMVLTHAHEDHIGALAYLWPDLKVPMYATPFTAKMIEGKFADLGIDASSYLFVMPLETRFLLVIFVYYTFYT
jgi:ribonuclease J